jgi:hypothetical protein
MSIHHRCALITTAIIVSIETSYAGPCSPQIDHMQSSVDALVAAAAVAGPPGRQSTAAMRHRQPTPSSVAAAEARIEEGNESSAWLRRWRRRGKPTALATMTLVSGRLLTPDARSVSRRPRMLASPV